MCEAWLCRERSGWLFHEPWNEAFECYAACAEGAVTVFVSQEVDCIADGEVVTVEVLRKGIVGPPQLFEAHAILEFTWDVFHV